MGLHGTCIVKVQAAITANYRYVRKRTGVQRGFTVSIRCFALSESGDMCR